jgi:hypothetical protein
MNQVPDDIERAPGLTPFVRNRPCRGQSTQERVESRRRAREDGESVVHCETTPCAIGL